LREHFKVPVTTIENRLVLESEKLSPQELQRVVTKFVYRRNLNNKYYVSLEGKTVAINTFKGVNKKPEKEKKNTLHQSAAQSWGL